MTENMMSNIDKEVEYLFLFLGIKIDDALLNEYTKAYQDSKLVVPPKQPEGEMMQEPVDIDELSTKAAHDGKLTSQSASKSNPKLEDSIPDEAAFLIPYFNYLGSVDSILDSFCADVSLHPVVIPDSYIQFYDAYFYEKCSLCNKMGMICVCLLCGEVMCKRYCDKVDGESQSPGNAAKHARECHYGEGIFVGVEDGDLFYYSGKKLSIENHLFTDYFGDNVFSAKKNFEKLVNFHLNRNQIAQICESYQSHQLRNKIIAQFFKLSANYREAFY
jgi:hypothetical protein